MKWILWLIFVFSFLIAEPIYAGVYNSTNMAYNYGSITDAVSAASSGDTILVSTGAYDETVYIYDTVLTIDGGYSNHCLGKASSGYTIINADDTAIFFKEAVRIGSNAVVRLEDLDIVDGKVSSIITRNGGGLIITEGSTVTVSQVRVYNNACNGYGGGIYVGDSSLYFINSQVYSNAAKTSNSGRQGSGGGLAANHSTVTFENSPLSYNWGEVNGGGIYVQSGAVVTVTGGSSDIEENRAEYGAGIFVTSATLFVESSADIGSNIATNDGGAIYLTSGSTGTISGNSTYIGYWGQANRAVAGSGGGCFANNSTLYLQNYAVIGTNQFRCQQWRWCGRHRFNPDSYQ